jgi:hypothetical protein
MGGFLFSGNIISTTIHRFLHIDSTVPDVYTESTLFILWRVFLTNHPILKLYAAFPPES